MDSVSASHSDASDSSDNPDVYGVNPYLYEPMPLEGVADPPPEQLNLFFERVVRVGNNDW
jgi:hypothetical protein